MKPSAEPVTISMLPVIRIVIADDHPVVRAGVKNIFSNGPGFVILGEAEDGNAAMTLVAKLKPDILLLDLLMPRLPALEAVREILSVSSEVKVVLLTSSITIQQVVEALQIGARGVLLKYEVAGDLPYALRAAVSGDYWIEGQRVVNLLEMLHELMPRIPTVANARSYKLTLRELDVIRCIVEGCNNNEIAGRCAISKEL